LRCVVAQRDGKENLEPGEYYGLKMLPLMMAAKRYDRDDYLDVAFRLARQHYSQFMDRFARAEAIPSHLSSGGW